MRFVIFHIILLIGFNTVAQNLVPNPGFEEYTELPCERPGINQPEKFTLKNWTWATITSPDLYNTKAKQNCEIYACLPGSEKRSAGHQIPRTGEGMAGLYIWGKFNHNEYHEYLNVELTEALVPGKKYYIEFWVTRSCLVDKASNNIGAYFTEKKIYRKNIASLYYTPHVNETSIITDSASWTRISGEFISDKAYGYLVIGNFFKDSQTDSKTVETCLNKSMLGNNEAYYYIDDVLVRIADEAIEKEQMKADIIDSIFLEAAKTHEPIVLENIFFEYDKDELKQESYPTLDKIIAFMNQMPQTKVEIAGFTDSKGESEYNQNLSERRAKSVVDYLIDKGVSENRLKYIGYGESMPNSELPDRNRRVEFKVLAD